MFYISTNYYLLLKICNNNILKNDSIKISNVISRNIFDKDPRDPKEF